MTDATNADLDALEQLIAEMASTYPYAVAGQVEALTVTLPAVIQELRQVRQERDDLRCTLVRMDHDLSGWMGDARVYREELQQIIHAAQEALEAGELIDG